MSPVPTKTQVIASQMRPVEALLKSPSIKSCCGLGVSIPRQTITVSGYLQLTARPSPRTAEYPH